MFGTPDYFKGKCLVVTGAASGMGRETALIFAREGADVVCADIDGPGAEKTAAACLAKGVRAEAIATDVSKRADVEAMIGCAMDAFGRVDFLFNCAGTALRRSTFLDIDDTLWEQAFAINANSVFYGMRAAIPHMLKQGKGVIVNVASMAHKRGAPGTSIHYASAKGAVVTMSLGVAREFAGRGIRCIPIAPGPTDTAFAAASQTSPEVKARFLADIPMGRMGRPEEFGELVLFLCSDACEFLTADTIYVSGGGGWR